MSTIDVAFEGEIDVASAPQLHERLKIAIEGNPGGTIRVDLRAVEFLDSTGLGILVRSMRRAREGGGEICLYGPRPNVRKVFEITGLDKVFDIQNP